MITIPITLRATYYNPANFFNVSKVYEEHFKTHAQLLIVRFDEWDNQVSHHCKVDRRANSSTAPRIMFQGGVNNSYRAWVQHKYKQGETFKLIIDSKKPNNVLLR